jgi:hypothetical protein
MDTALMFSARMPAQTASEPTPAQDLVMALFPDGLADQFARLLTVLASGYLAVRIGMGLLA